VLNSICGEGIEEPMTQGTYYQKMGKWEWMRLGALTLLASILLLANLGNHYLWQDEAQTALIAETVMARGMPYGTDGKNFFSQEQGAEYGKGFIWRWHTWLPFYLVAGSFEIMGIGTFSARLPFALIGIALVPLLYFFAAGLWRDRRIGEWTAILFVFCIPFLILSRQCRYYSPVAFFSVLGLLAYHMVLEDRRWAVPLFVLASTLLFHTHYLYFVTLLATVAAHCLIFQISAWRKVGLACLVSSALAIPWVLWLAGMKYEDRYGNKLLDLGEATINTKEFLGQIGRHLLPNHWPLLLVAVLCLAWVSNRGPRWRSNSTWSSLAIPIMFSTITTATLALTVPWPFFRYLSPIVPMVVVLEGWIVGQAFKVHRLGGLALLAYAIACQPITDYAYELTHDFKGPIKGIVSFLGANAQPGDVIAITYGDMPLKFYTALRVVGGLTGEDLSLAKEARWVIIRPHRYCVDERRVRRYFLKNLDLKNYRRIVIDYPDTRYENRESPDEHLFRTSETGYKVVILEQVGKGDGSGVETPADQGQLQR
jgi:hypothetical protein